MANKKNQVAIRNNTIYFGNDFQVVLHRTIRIPDTHKAYNLPVSMGKLSVELIDKYKDSSHMPKKWLKHGGVFTVMHPNDAMWIGFSGVYAHAVKVAFGKINAVNGKPWTNRLTADDQDYLVAPRPQYWLDGINFGDNVVRQIVAARLGSGKTIEGQITNKEDVGGLQLMVIPAKHPVHLERRTLGAVDIDWKLAPNQFGSYGLNSSRTIKGATRGSSAGNSGGELFAAGIGIDHRAFNVAKNRSSLESNDGSPPHLEEQMGIAAGGKIKQTLYKDDYGVDFWDQDAVSRCFVHIASPELWERITGQTAPKPLTRSDYEQQGLPWVEKYEDETKDMLAPQPLKNVKSVGQYAGDKGQEPEADIDDNASYGVGYSDVRDGDWFT